MTNEEKVNILLYHFGDMFNNIDLSNIDLGDATIYLTGIKTNGYIYNDNQKADYIINRKQKSNKTMY